MGFFRRFCFISLLGLVGMVAIPAAGSASTKLYLKDGSYQLVKSYEVRGDRVRYYSIERSDWEEIPASLVDFDTTKRVQQQTESEQTQRVDQARRIEHERFEVAPSTGYEVAPGYHLPSEDGVYAFDGLRVVTLIQSAGQVVTDKKRLAMSIALPGPLLKNRSLVQLDGAHAAVRLMSLEPVFYIRAADNWGAKAELIPVKSAKETRVVEKIQSGIGVGKSGELRDAIPLERQQIEPGLCRIKPVAPIEVGEYALGELVQGGRLNLEVWDFGVDGRPGPLPTTGDTSSAPMTEEAPEGHGPPSRPGVRQPPNPNLPSPDQGAPPLPAPPPQSGLPNPQ